MIDSASKLSFKNVQQKQGKIYLETINKIMSENGSQSITESLTHPILNKIHMWNLCLYLNIWIAMGKISVFFVEELMLSQQNEIS